jgi:ELP3 family radical SAM enzyme/protein acetyltransferase
MDTEKKRGRDELMDLEDIGRVADKLNRDEFYRVLFNMKFNSIKDLRKKVSVHSRKNKLPTPSLHDLNKLYKSSIDTTLISPNESWEKFIISVPSRSRSGIIVVAIQSKPLDSCPADCHYCSDETIKNGAKIDMPRSYTSESPASLRAIRNGFDACDQIIDRISSLYFQGHDISKVELMVLGGTWSNYPEEYKQTFIRDTFYAVNCFINGKYQERDRLSLKEEQKINETAEQRVVGLTIETRPDWIKKEEIISLRNLGVTRVQIGIQHTNNQILKKVNRGHTIEDSMDAIKLLKYNGFKIVAHFMPDLYGSTPEWDIEMFRDLLNNPMIKPDEIKIYPCMVVPYSVLHKKYMNGQYKPYFEEEGGSKKLMDVILYFLERCPEYMRIDRVIRDIPMTQTAGGVNRPNMRQDLDKDMKERGTVCNDIRMREVKDETTNIQDLILNTIEYESSGGKEFYIQWISGKNTLHGHLRLRFNFYGDDIVFPVLHQAAIIRELHVYGKVVDIDDGSNSSAQHRGLGKKLIHKAEEIAMESGYKKIVVISGVGTREYYKNKCGYHLDKTGGEYMVKDLTYQSYIYELKNFPWFPVSFILGFYFIFTQCIIYINS